MHHHFRCRDDRRIHASKVSQAVRNLHPERASLRVAKEEGVLSMPKEGGRPGILPVIVGVLGAGASVVAILTYMDGRKAKAPDPAPTPSIDVKQSIDLNLQAPEPKVASPPDSAAPAAQAKPAENPDDAPSISSPPPELTIRAISADVLGRGTYYRVALKVGIKNESGRSVKATWVNPEDEAKLVIPGRDFTGVPLAGGRDNPTGIGGCGFNDPEACRTKRPTPFTTIGPNVDLTAVIYLRSRASQGGQIPLPAEMKAQFNARVFVIDEKTGVGKIQPISKSDIVVTNPLRL